MTKNIARLLDTYGNGKFGDSWWPREPSGWLTEDESEQLKALIQNKDANNPETARLLFKYGQSRFAHKWLPEQADYILGEKGANAIREHFDIPEMSLAM